MSNTYKNAIFCLKIPIDLYRDRRIHEYIRYLNLLLSYAGTAT